MPPLISVALATCNGAHWLETQLSSIAEQSLPPMEMVVSDDASTDGTLDILSHFRKHAPFPVVVVSNDDRVGFTDNFWRAVQLCRGDWVAYCDQDDYWVHGKLAACAAEMDRDNVGLIYHAYEEVDTDLKPLGITLPSLTARRLIRRGGALPIGLDSVAGCAEVVRMSVARTILASWPGDHARRVKESGYTTLLAHDYVTFVVAHAVSDIVILPLALVKHRRHGRNTSGTLSLGKSSSVDVLRATFATGVRDYEKAAAIFEARSKYYSAVASSDRQAAFALEPAAASAARVAGAYEARSRLYASHGFYARLRHWIELARTGVYGGICNGYRRALKDLATVARASCNNHRFRR